jgi:hypothetical protein
MLHLHKGVAFARRNAARGTSSFVFGDGYATDGDDGGSIMISFTSLSRMLPARSASAAELSPGP